MAVGAPFTQRWHAVTRLPTRTGTLRVTHPDAGALRLEFETLDLAGDQRLVVHLPADDATAAALDALVGRRPGALRTVR